MKDNVKINIKDQVNDIQKKYNNFFTKVIIIIKT